jgi:hypothetical protein
MTAAVDRAGYLVRLSRPQRRGASDEHRRPRSTQTVTPIDLKVTGMTCASCAARMKKLNKVPVSSPR